MKTTNKKVPNKFMDKEDEKFDKKNFHGKGKGKGKGKSFSSKEDFKDAPHRKGGRPANLNDPDWYYIDEQHGYDAGNLPWSEILGIQTDLNQDGSNDAHFTETSRDFLHKHRFPGVLALKIAPAIGVSTSVDSAINVAARAIYAHVRYANSGATNYESTDLMMYLLMMDQIYSYHNWITRLYGLARIASQKNRYIPRTLIAANGVDPTSIQSNLNDFRAWINVFGSKIAQFAVPAVFPYIRRHSMLFRDVYADNDIAKAQMYMYVPAGFWKYVEKTDVGTPAKLEFESLEGTTMTFPQIRTFGEVLLSSLVASETFAIMSGDIAKAYDPSNCYVVPNVDENYFTIPQYNEELLNQIANATSFYAPDLEGGSWDVTQVIPSVDAPDTASYLVFNPTVQAEAPYSNSVVLSVDKDQVDWRDNLVNTRLTALPIVKPMGPADVGKDSSNTKLYTCGSEICVGIEIWDDPTKTDHSAYTNTPVFTSMNSTDAVYYLRFLSLLSGYNHHPQINLYKVANANEWDYLGLYFMVDNYTVLNSVTLDKLHQCALMGEFRTPQMGTQEV